MANTPVHTVPQPGKREPSPARGAAGEPSSAPLPVRGVRVSLAALVCSVFLLVVATPLSYLCGVMIGREYPVRAKTEMEVWAEKAGEQARASAAARRGAEGAAGTSEGDVSSRILSPQELSFARLLHVPPGEKDVAHMRPLAPAVPRDTQKKRPAGEEDVPGLAEAMPPGMSPAVVEGPPQPPARKADTFDFVFQVAAYRGTAAAEGLRLRLESRGYRARLEKSGRLVLVLVLVRGPASRAAEVREDMIRMKMGAPIERSRRPVLRSSVR